MEVMKEQIIEAIEKELERKGMTQAELGELVGMKRHSVNAALRGTERTVSIQRLVNMAEAIGLDVELKIKRISR